MNKTAIKNFAIWARNKLIKEITYKAGLVGVTEKGIADALPQSTKEMQWFNIGTSEPSSIQGEAVKQREKLVLCIKEKEKESDYKTAYTSIIEEVAYTWFNRLIAIRFMEVNDYLPSRVRVLSSETSGKEEPDLVTSPFDTDLEFTSVETDRIMQYKDSNQLDELFRMLFIKQCNKLNEVLPELFEKTADYTELLLNISYTDKDGVVYHLTHDIDSEDFCVRENEAGQVTGQIEIIGWLYQYYNTEPKDEAFALLKKNVKVTKERIPAVTQLFTPEWIVKYMVENSLGRLWVEGHPDNELKKNWKYYLEEVEQEEEVKKQLEVIREEYRQLKPEDIKIIDPCMGSGHILVYAFEVLMQIYESYGYSQRDAAKSIIENNIYGLDIDNRAYQLAYFSLMMKARQYNRRILTDEIKPHIYAIKGSNAITSELIDFIAGKDKQIKLDVKSICRDLKDAEEYGSILSIEPVDFCRLYKRIDYIKENFYDDIFGQQNRKNVLEQILPLIKQAHIMSQTYEVVVTNPPYMGAGNMGSKLSTFTKKVYPNSKNDLYAVFIERCKLYTEKNKFVSLITQHTWMYLSRYLNLRNEILDNNIVNLLHLGARAFEEIGGEVVQTASYIIRKSNLDNYIGAYVRLVNEPNQLEKKKAYMEKANRYYSKNTLFKKIPGNMFVYWESDKFIENFINVLIGEKINTRVGLDTGDNERYIRYWAEVQYNKIGYSVESTEQFHKLNYYKWVPHTKGGQYRKWYGNFEYVLAFDEYNYNKLLNSGNHLPSRQFYFQEGINWSRISTSNFSVRYTPVGMIFNSACPTAFANKDTLIYCLGLLNSKIVEGYVNALSPTMNFQVGDIDKVPYITDEKVNDLINNIVEANIQIAKMEWDLFETSWDFKKHPLLNLKFNNNGNKLISSIFETFNQFSCRQFEELKTNEKELNKIFIELYQLGEELTPELEDADITLRKADLQREIRSFISYAIGCMFGRYSLDVDGLTYAGGKWEDDKYTSFIPDEDNIILVTEDEYFADDIVNCFVEFVKVVYGQETLEENLDFIANALGNKGNTSREVIRNYFIKDFYKDHCKTYQKRPIYWMFDSGKQNGFKALIYMHRYNADTIGNLRIDYLHRLQKVYESEMARMQDIVDNSNNAKESTAAAKRRDKIVKQLQETKDYDQKIAHLALARIEIDLDDGVKVNYEKVQTGTDGKKLQVLAKI